MCFSLASWTARVSNPSFGAQPEGVPALAALALVNSQESVDNVRDLPERVAVPIVVVEAPETGYGVAALFLIEISPETLRSRDYRILGAQPGPYLDLFRENRCGGIITA